MHLDDLSEMPVDVVEKIPVGDEAVFDHLGHAGVDFAPGEGFQVRRVDQHQFGHVKEADQVLAQRMVDGDLAADRAVGHREQCGGELDDRNPPVVARGDIAAEVADDAATHGEQVPAPVDIRFDHLAVEAQRRAETLGGFPGGNDQLDHRKSCGPECSENVFPEKPPGVFVKKNDRFF